MSRQEFSWGLQKDLVASTYSAETYINRLYFENEYLFRNRPTYSVGPGERCPSPEIVDSHNEYSFVRQFLRETENSSRSKQSEKHLVIANEYTTLQNQYTNGFIHRRIKNYQAAGLDVEVMAFGKRLPRDVYQYDGVSVLSGFYNELLGLLAAREYSSISVHFMNNDMWKALKANIPEGLPVLVYSHGYEVRNWTRMPHQIRDRRALDDHIERNLRSRDVWNEMYEPNSGISKFIFVSNFWRRAVSEDIMLPFDNKRTTVIPNVIDNNLFTYEEKHPDQRFKLLWLRTASKWNYGADLAAELLRRLKETPLWDQVEVTIIGDGEFFSYFDQFSDDKNVRIHRGYVSQYEIARLHKQHGLFLVPSRWDTQGVSRDEAMSSGLIPITCPIGPIPEFANDSCAVLGLEDDIEEWFGKLVEVINSPERFCSMSKQAAEHVRQISSPDQTVAKEISLMKGSES